MHRAKRFILWVGCLATVSGIWITLCFQVAHDRKQAQITAETNAANLAKTLEEHVLSTVQQIDSILLILRDDYLQHPKQFTDHLTFFKKYSHNNLIIQTTVIDADGHMVFSEQPRPAVPAGLGDREDFRVHRDSGNDILFISKPVFDPVSRKWTIQLTRKIFRRDGTFGGVVVLSVDPEFFSSFYRSVDLGKNGVVTLVGTDRVIRARSVVDKNNPYGKITTLPADRPLFDQSQPAAGIYHLPSVSDGIDRLWAYRRFQNYPLIVAVGITEDVVNSPTDTRKNHLIIWGVIVSALLLIGTRVILWFDQQQQKIEGSLREAKQRLELATDSARLGIWDWDIPTGALAWNARMFELYGIDPESFSGQVEEFQKGVHPDDLAGAREAIKTAIEGEKEYVNEFRVLYPDGTVKTIKADGLVIRDRDGKAVRMIGLNSDITERKLAEQAQKETSERFMKLLETIPTVAVQGYELDGTVIYWNQASETLYGYAANEALGANLLDLIIPPKMPVEVVQAIQHMKETGISVPAYEVSKLRKDGSLVAVHSSHAIIQTAGSRPVLFSMDIDLSERKRMEEKLQLASDEWRKTFDTIPDMIIIVDNEHRIVRANRATWQKLGCEMQDLVGKPCYSVFHGLDSPPESCPHAQLMLDGLAHSEEVFEPRLNGYLDVTVTPLRDPDGKMTGSIHVAHDISSLKRAGEALRESESLYRSIITASPDNITITDMQGCIRMVSPKGLAMFGYEREDEVSGRSILEFIAREDRERATDDLMQVFQGTYTWPGEYRARRADGSPITVEANGDFIIGAGGQPESMIFAIRDITERKRVEDELNRKNIEIEQFIYTVSHDLRSPLVTVKTFLGYLEQDISECNGDRIGKDMEFINSAADRMEVLLNELLDMARVGRGTDPLEAVSFQELAAEALDALAGQIAAGRVDVQVSAANPTLNGDRRRLLQIWQNLLDNALKYMGDQAQPRIEIGIEQQHGETVFIVSDNGIGIAPEYHEKVFGIFEKLDREIGGVGMGLTMVKRVVETYGGQIRVESEGRGNGSCFRFTLPEAVQS